MAHDDDDGDLFRSRLHSRLIDCSMAACYSPVCLLACSLSQAQFFCAAAAAVAVAGTRARMCV